LKTATRTPWTSDLTGRRNARSARLETARTQFHTRLLFITVICLISVIGLSTAVPAADAKLELRIDRARHIFEKFQLDSTIGEPTALMRRAKCLAIFPNLIRVAFVLGGRHGIGVVSCRNLEGKWSPPAFARLSEGSFGIQVGYQSSEVVFFFVTDGSAKSLLTAKLSMGADVSIAAGPLEKNAGVTTDPEWAADVYIYSKSKGVFAGAAFQGSRLAISHELLRRYYERQIWIEEVLLAHRVPILPPKAKEFMEALQLATD